MSGYSDKKLKKFYDAYEKCGDYAEVAKQFNVKKSTIRRELRRARKMFGGKVEETPDAMLMELRNVYSPAEIRALIKGKKTARERHTAIHEFSGQRVRIGYMTDTHIGSKYTDPAMIQEAFDMFKEKNVDMLCHSGDVTEGMYNGRAGHVLECTEIGFERQLEASVNIFKQFDHCPMYFISGNHDDTFKLQSGASIVGHMCQQLDNATFLGHGEGDVVLGNTTVKLWHGGDGSSYAVSYRLQKVVEAFTGGEKPNVLLAGHTHKATYLYDRHIHVVSGGCIQKQSQWMRQKRLGAHTGFWIIDMVLNDKGVGTFTSTFYPFYV